VLYKDAEMSVYGERTSLFVKRSKQSGKLVAKWTSRICPDLSPAHCLKLMVRLLQSPPPHQILSLSQPLTLKPLSGKGSLI
jgi:hypothetical protein